MSSTKRFKYLSCSLIMILAAISCVTFSFAEETSMPATFCRGGIVPVKIIDNRSGTKNKDVFNAKDLTQLTIDCPTEMNDKTGCFDFKNKVDSRSTCTLKFKSAALEGGPINMWISNDNIKRSYTWSDLKVTVEAEVFEGGVPTRKFLKIVSVTLSD